MSFQKKCSIYLFLFFSFLLPVLSAQGAEEKKPFKYIISNIQWEQTADDFLLRIQGATPPQYLVYQLFDPLRIVLDIGDATISDVVELPMNLNQGPVAGVQGKILDDNKPFIARVEVLLLKDESYVVERINNDILIKFSKNTRKKDKPVVKASGARGNKVKKSPAQPASVKTSSPDSPANFTKSPAQPFFGNASIIYEVDVQTSPGITMVNIKADGPIKEYRHAKLKKNGSRPDRMYIDIPDVKSPYLQKEKRVGTALSKIRMARRGGGVRIVFDSGLTKMFDHELIIRQDGLAVAIKNPDTGNGEDAGVKQVIASLLASEEGGPAGNKARLAGQQGRPGENNEIIIEPLDSRAVMEKIVPVIPIEWLSETVLPESEIIIGKSTDSGSMEKQSAKVKTPEKAPVKPRKRDEFAGYTKKRITIDYFKIDLINVFRLFGEISGLNIVVDETITGTLTLSLTDVPWDFALDVILNLNQLKKIERYNTLIIAPMTKEFDWPQRPVDTLDYREDISVSGADAIKIKERLMIPKEELEAKKLVRQGNNYDKNQNYQEALKYYEEAFAKWPKNDKLAVRISSLCLVQLGMNATAANYAKAALKANPGNLDAALQAAIALARMKKTSEAKDHFDIAIGKSKPSQEALSSYATFCEEYKSYGAAIMLLQKYKELYGNTMETMVARARLFDNEKMKNRAAREYRALLLSGYELPADLRRYIKSRLARAKKNK
jgi:type IV pilus assembly protein PilQ